MDSTTCCDLEELHPNISWSGCILALATVECQLQSNARSEWMHLTHASTVCVTAYDKRSLPVAGTSANSLASHSGWASMRGQRAAAHPRAGLRRSQPPAQSACPTGDWKSPHLELDDCLLIVWEWSVLQDEKSVIRGDEVVWVDVHGFSRGYPAHKGVR